MVRRAQEESWTRERKNPGKPASGELSKLSAFEAIEKLAEYNSLHTGGEDGVELFLKSWWSKTYNRPLKDPLLQQYTVQELLYEYHDKVERTRAADIEFEEEADKIEEEQEQGVLDWVEEEERKDREEAEAKQKEQEKQEEQDEKWMLEQLKKEHGEDFGEDIDSNLSE